ncbi:TetR/AcrR family transcriptional regulator [Leptospira stimsonii]|uniref:TetR/AcrR family transcriptional regulator n=1 Tax=Leptospira stimsonii TaxID=2202203 RepID=A0ABY2NAM5_9LEPT|nr:TetR/AcrR family transcriptional regulator [Leptospira stimsonii]TGM20236.1 TetR/AcrR family transcriptional regulator [Leptospira stimsonii]
MKTRRRSKTLKLPSQEESKIRPRKKTFLGFSSSHPSKKESKKSFETKEKLLEATLSVFGSKGFHEARVEDITAHAGFAKGTFYEHFDSKDDLIYILIDYAARKDLEITQSLFQRCKSSIAIRDQYLKPILLDIQSKKELNRVCYQFLTNEILTKEKLQKKTDYYNRLYQRYHRRSIKLAQKLNLLNPNFETEEIYVMFRYLIDGFTINQAYSFFCSKSGDVEINSILKLFDQSLLVTNSNSDQ